MFVTLFFQTGYIPIYLVLFFQLEMGTAQLGLVLGANIGHPSHLQEHFEMILVKENRSSTHSIWTISTVQDKAVSSLINKIWKWNHERNTESILSIYTSSISWDILCYATVANRVSSNSCPEVHES